MVGMLPLPTPQRHNRRGRRGESSRNPRCCFLSAFASFLTVLRSWRLRAALSLIPFFLALCARAGSSPSDSFYVRSDPNNDGVIIFVHGVTGNSRSTWTADRSGRFWPEMLLDHRGASKLAFSSVCFGS
jgi:hypothetical protein